MKEALKKIFLFREEPREDCFSPGGVVFVILAWADLIGIIVSVYLYIKY